MTIIKLREAVMDALSVPTHQQRLTLGNLAQSWKTGKITDIVIMKYLLLTILHFVMGSLGV